jgi:hypothetical protein
MSIGSFRVATQRMHDAVMEEFGDLQADVPYDSETSQDTVVPEDRDMPAAGEENDIAAVEIPSQPQDAETTVEV